GWREEGGGDVEGEEGRVDGGRVLLAVDRKLHEHRRLSFTSLASDGGSPAPRRPAARTTATRYRRRAIAGRARGPGAERGPSAHARDLSCTPPSRAGRRRARPPRRRARPPV